MVYSIQIIASMLAYDNLSHKFVAHPFRSRSLTVVLRHPYTTRSFLTVGQVAQLVERGPEKAGVGGSIPSLATNPPTT